MNNQSSIVLIQIKMYIKVKRAILPVLTDNKEVEVGLVFYDLLGL